MGADLHGFGADVAGVVVDHMNVVKVSLTGRNKRERENAEDRPCWPAADRVIDETEGAGAAAFTQREIIKNAAKPGRVRAHARTQ